MVRPIDLPESDPHYTCLLLVRDLEGKLEQSNLQVDALVRLAKEWDMDHHLIFAKNARRLDGHENCDRCKVIEFWLDKNAGLFTEKRECDPVAGHLWRGTSTQSDGSDRECVKCGERRTSE